MCLQNTMQRPLSEGQWKLQAQPTDWNYSNHVRISRTTYEHLCPTWD
jgi:hypothetical protein